MKGNPLVSIFLVVLFVSVVSLSAQQTNSSSSVTNGTTIQELIAKAENGDAESQFELGASYLLGEGAPIDYKEAVKWLLKSADQGNAKAQCDLGLMYEDGDGVTKDEKEAVNWYHKAAEQGSASGQNNLGICYRDGIGVTCNGAEAVKWFLKAATVGSEDAQYNLGCIFSDGNLVPQDYSAAVKWYRKAAEQGRMDAQNSLGAIYAGGKGVPQDYVEAYKWFNVSAAQGDKNAINNRDELISLMTPEQIAEAQELSREFKPHQESGSDNSTSPDSPIASGTGFFITDDGYLISNYHVVKDAAQVRVVTSSGTVPAKVVQVDTANDIALLKVEGKFSALPIAASQTVRLGDTVATVGFPDPDLQGFSPKLAKGEIAALAGAMDDPHYFQISVPVQPGNSGGALMDENGNVVGIVSAKLDAATAFEASGALPENVNYAIKSGFLLSFLESVPDVESKLKAPNTADEKFENVVKSAQDATVLVLVY